MRFCDFLKLIKENCMYNDTIPVFVKNIFNIVGNNYFEVNKPEDSYPQKLYSGKNGSRDFKITRNIRKCNPSEFNEFAIFDALKNSFSTSDIAKIKISLNIRFSNQDNVIAALTKILVLFFKYDEDKIQDNIQELIAAAGKNNLNIEKNTQPIEEGPVETAFGFNYDIYLDETKTYLSKIRNLWFQSAVDIYTFYVNTNVMVSTTEEIIIDPNVPKIIEKVGNYAILVGTGGQGKSMMMTHLALQAIKDYNESKKVPIFVPLRYFDRDSNNLYDYIYKIINNKDSTFSKTIFENELRSGKFILLLDGIDEIGLSQYNAFKLELFDFTEKYKYNIIIMSSRPNNEFPGYSQYQILKLQPLDEAGILNVAKKLLDASKYELFVKSLPKLTASHSSFITNPLLLTVLLLSFDSLERIPDKKYYFYQSAYEALAKNHDITKPGVLNRELSSRISVDEFKPFVTEFCCKVYLEGKNTLSEQEYESIYSKLKIHSVSGIKISSSNFARDLDKVLCLMYKEGDRYKFYHDSFLEYFTVLYTSYQPDNSVIKIGKKLRQVLDVKDSDVLDMLTDCAPEKLTRLILIPAIEDSIEGIATKNDDLDESDYLAYMQKVHPIIEYRSNPAHIVNLTYENRIIEYIVNKNTKSNLFEGYLALDQSSEAFHEVNMYSIETAGNFEMLWSYYGPFEVNPFYQEFLLLAKLYKEYKIKFPESDDDDDF